MDRSRAPAAARGGNATDAKLSHETLAKGDLATACCEKQRNFVVSTTAWRPRFVAPRDRLMVSWGTGSTSALTMRASTARPRTEMLLASRTFRGALTAPSRSALISGTLGTPARLRRTVRSMRPRSASVISASTQIGTATVADRMAQAGGQIRPSAARMMPAATEAMTLLRIGCLSAICLPRSNITEIEIRTVW